MNRYKFSEISVGLEGTFKATITSEMMEKFQSISGDINPLHLSSDYAKAEGFDDRVVYGMLTASFYSTLAGVYLPGENCLLHGLDTSFSSPVYIGDELTISGKVSYINEAYKQIEVKAKIVNQNDKVVSKAKLRVGVRSE